MGAFSSMRASAGCAAAVLVFAAIAVAPGAARAAFIQTDLQSTVPGLAAATDPDLVNPIGIALGPTSALFLADNGTGLSTVYNGSGAKLGLVISIPGSGVAQPTGAVFNTTSAFSGDLLLYATGEGRIAGWRPALGTTAEVLADFSGLGASFTGIALGSTAGGTYIYAANFAQNRIEVFPSLGAPLLAGNFTDPTLPAGFAPFNVQRIGGQIFVTYAPVAGGSGGIVDIYDLDGNLVRRLTSGGPLDQPWGLALAPAGFGAFGNALLVGNHGDGTIDAFDPSTGGLLGQLEGGTGDPLVNEGLWALQFGNGGNGGALDELFFTAGINGGNDGLFGKIASTAVPEPGTLALGAVALIGIALRRPRSASASAG